MKTSRTLSLVLSLAMCLLAMSSCKREDLPSGSVSKKIKAKVSTSNQDTKSKYKVIEDLAQTILLDEKEELYLQEFVSDNLSQPFGADNIQTKGAVITTENIGGTYGQFGMEGFLDNFSEIDCPEEKWPKVYVGGKYEKLKDDCYIIGGKCTYSSSIWTLKDGGNQEYPWLNNIDFTIWSYAPKDHNGSFTYGSTGARSKMTITNFENPFTASAQKDLLVAYNKHNYPTDGEEVDILFRHALADICFDVTPGLTINEIKISGANSKGNCEISSANLYKIEKSRDMVEAGFYWTSNTPANFTMSSATDHFFMIPQNFSGSITISLNNGKTFTTSLSTNWQAGKYYKYKLTYNGLEISVDDNVEGNVKKNVVIKSTSASTVKCYIRALIIGNWHQNLGTTSEPVPGAVMAPWSLANGTFSPALAATVGTAVNNWVLGSDGYYYYKYPVYPNTETGTGTNGKGTPDKLFSSYTAPEAAPVSGSFLCMTVLVQGVRWDEQLTFVTNAWGATAANYLSKTDKQ